MFYCFYVKFKVIDLLISLPSDSTSSFPEEDKRRGSEGAREREREREREEQEEEGSEGKIRALK